MNSIKIIVTQTGATFEARAAGWPAVGRGPTFKEAIGEWVYINVMSTNLTIDGPIFHPDSAAVPVSMPSHP